MKVFPIEGVGVKSRDFLDGRRVVSPGNVIFWSAVAQSHAKYFISIEPVRGMRNTSSMGTAKKSLAQTHPALAKEAHGWNPKDFVAGSHKKLKWECSKGHIFESSIEIRTKQKTKCPVCEGRVIVTGFNDLKKLFPAIAKEADGWDPSLVGTSSNKSYQWKCSKKHIWKSNITSRIKGHMKICPTCFKAKVELSGKTDLKSVFPKLAKEASGWNPAEFTYISGEKVEWKCPKGHAWKNVIRDRIQRGTTCPVCSGKQILVGVSDLKTTHPEIAREAYAWDPSTIQKNSQKKVQWKCSNGHLYESSVISRTRLKSGCPICAGNVLDPGKTDLASTHPEIAKELMRVDPKTIKAGSHKKFEWLCPTGHIYEASAGSRLRGSNCPICSGHRVQAGFNDLQTTHPEIAAQADGWDPTKVSAGSNKFYKWKCSKGHLWKSVLYGRLQSKEVSCPICSGKKILVGFNDLATTHPKLAKEAYKWDPTTLNAGSNRKVKWKCELGHITSALVYNRTIRGDNCPVCAGREVLAGFNDLKTTHPLIARDALEFDPTKFIAGSNVRLKWKCPEGHVWSTSPNSRTGEAGTGCPSCAKSGFDPNKDGWLYFLDHPTWELLQIGITNDPKRRIATHQKLGWEVIELRGPMDGLLTQNWETAMLRTLKKRGARLSPEEVAGKFDGYSEAWTKGSFRIDSLKALMALVEEDDTHVKEGRRS